MFVCFCVSSVCFLAIYIHDIFMSWFCAVRVADCCVCCVSCMNSSLSFTQHRSPFAPPKTFWPYVYNYNTQLLWTLLLEHDRELCPRANKLKIWMGLNDMVNSGQARVLIKRGNYIRYIKYLKYLFVKGFYNINFHHFECKVRMSYSEECLFKLSSVKHPFSTIMHFHWTNYTLCELGEIGVLESFFYDFRHTFCDKIIHGCNTCCNLVCHIIRVII